MRIYISGAISNEPKYKENFARAEKKLKELGYSVLNPTVLNAFDCLSYEEYMKLDFQLIDMCDGLCMLNGWEYSRGANREYHYAIAKELVVFSEEDIGDMKKRRHLMPNEIKAQLNAIAREKRMADRSPWSAMSIICPYVIMKCEGFKGQRISCIVNKITEMEEQWEKGEIDLQEVSKKLYDKAEWTIEYKQWTEADITAKKGSYKHWLDKIQLEPQNRINQHAARYMLFFFTALMEEYRFGKERLTRVEEYMNNLLLEYQQNKTTVKEWNKALLEEAGVYIEMPIDPLTQTSGSIMTG